MPARPIRVLLVEDDEKMRKLLENILLQRGHSVTACADGDSAWEAFQKKPFPIVLLDWTMPGRIDGLELCRNIRQFPQGDFSVLMAVTGRNKPDDIRAMLAAGVDDYLVKPFDVAVFDVRIEIAEQRSRGLEAVIDAGEKMAGKDKPAKSAGPFQGMTGECSAMQAVFRRLNLAADCDVPVMILGESGSGKELAAAAIHAISPRKKGPFVAVNCSAFPETLLEAELFGYVKGAFTGAVRDKTGIFQSAHGGTLFLDEIGDISPASQVKLLRCLEEKKIRRLGDDRAVDVDIRLISATNRNVADLVASGAMREDFYYRIHVFEVSLPPLRDRRDDIPALVGRFLDECAAKQNKPPKQASREALQVLLCHSWPGNIRQLKNTIEQAFVTAESDTISPQDLSSDIRHPSAPQKKRAVQPPAALTPERLAERKTIEEALAKVNGSRTEAAKILGYSRVTLWKKIKHLGIESA